MSDMRPPMGGAPPSGGAPPAGANPVMKNMSVMNGADAAYMKSRGQISEDQTIEQYIQGAFGLPVTAPVAALAAKVKEQMGNASMKGKMQNMGQAPRPATPPMGGGQPPIGGGMGQAARPPEQSLQGLLGSLK